MQRPKMENVTSFLCLISTQKLGHPEAKFEFNYFWVCLDTETVASWKFFVSEEQDPWIANEFEMQDISLNQLIEKLDEMGTLFIPAGSKNN